jgi:hypothetical protein
MSKEAALHKETRAERAKRQPKDGAAEAVAATIRWAQVLPVDFEGEDASLTQAQLAILK